MNSARRLQGTETQSQSINEHTRNIVSDNPESLTIPTQPLDRVAPTQRVSGVSCAISLCVAKANLDRFVEYSMIETEILNLRGTSVLI